METIFEHNYTNKEFCILFVKDNGSILVIKYYLTYTGDRVNFHLFELLNVRNDVLAGRYFDLIKRVVPQFSLC